MQATELEMEVFRAGDYGDKGRWSEDDLARIAADYDPATHEAPVTLDHAQAGPAMGWVRGLRAAGPVLLATLGQLSDELKGWLAGGRFKKRSIELYPAFPATGRPYLRAVSFLGAAVPEVKGLADPLFADEAAEALRLPFVEDDLSDSSLLDPTEQSSLSASGSSPVQSSLPHSSPDSESALAETERLRREVARLEREAAGREVEAECQALEREGRLPPAWRGAGIVVFMEALRAAEINSTLNRSMLMQFGEGENAPPAESPFRWFVRFLHSLPPLIPMGGVLPAFSGTFEPAPFPQGVPVSARVNPASLERHRRALALQSASPALTYSEALLKSCTDGHNSC